ncbi:uncharacterized protein LOC116614003 isoform X2 [Nematostella vectensis]|uniref:uncharacterized protein LOC116614003 isoform X2 n=1 Tax=Nematostella vectensis TaxID=45351 RepID=UPI0020776FE6|nr:uncharacterized protein LOC116614003 isoform X2 [Nematostella vectensis]
MAAAIVTLVLLLLTASTILALRRGERERTGGFDKKEHHVLVGHVISLHNVTSPMDCALLCVADMRCASYNIRKKVICELSNETETSKPGSLQQDPECDYYHGLNETLAIFTTAMPTPAETTTTALTTTAPLPTTAPSTGVHGQRRFGDGCSALSVIVITNPADHTATAGE